MKYHQNKSGQWLHCRAQPGNCPFGGNHENEAEVRAQAVQAFRRGMPIPTLTDNAGNVRRFTFREDGSYTFGSRTYDRHGVMQPSERTAKRDRLSRWREYRAMTPEEKAEQFTGDLMAYELKRGQFRGSALSIEQAQAYVNQHHRGSFFGFFKSVWDSCSDIASPLQRYGYTLNRMWMAVTEWWRKAA